MATFTNKATLSYNGRTTDSNTVTVFFTESLSVAKNALSDVYSDGTVLTYVISIVNSGTTSFSGLVVEDDLGGYEFNGNTVYPLDYVEDSIAYYVGGVLQVDPTVTADGNLTVSGISVPQGSSAILIYQAEVNENAPLDVDGEIVNTVRVSGAGIPEPLTASETVRTLDEAELSITKALFPTTVAENGAITYTFVIQNTGNTEAVATDNVVVTDLFDPILDITSVTLDGVVLTEGVDYTYDPATGQFATVEGRITVPAATYTQEADGSFTVVPGSVTLVVNGNLQ